MQLGLEDGLTLVRMMPKELGKYLSRGDTKVSLKSNEGSQTNQRLGSDKRLLSVLHEVALLLTEPQDLG
ncbi:hypothetical protein J6590_041617 [Homalodisca vitripennis]|nr:hypothetical protein J6590_041617 [Homalodisca vitripennis]